MAQIKTTNTDRQAERIDLQSGDPDLEFISAKDLAKQAAQERSPDAMLLSWHNTKTGEHYPRYDCGGHDRPAWVLFAESRGANLTVDVDDGDYVFMFLLF
jgi:hypothetical protein